MKRDSSDAFKVSPDGCPPGARGERRTLHRRQDGDDSTGQTPPSENPHRHRHRKSRRSRRVVLRSWDGGCWTEPVTPTKNPSLDWTRDPSPTLTRPEGSGQWVPYERTRVDVGGVRFDIKIEDGIPFRRFCRSLPFPQTSFSRDVTLHLPTSVTLATEESGWKRDSWFLWVRRSEDGPTAGRDSRPHNRTQGENECSHGTRPPVHGRPTDGVGGRDVEWGLRTVKVWSTTRATDLMGRVWRQERKTLGRAGDSWLRLESCKVPRLCTILFTEEKYN